MKRNKSRPRPLWIDNINEDMTSLGVTLRDALDFDHRLRTPMEII